MKNLLLTTIILIAYSNAAMADNITVNQLTADYKSQGAGIGNLQAGEQLWNKTFSGKAPFSERRCATCHTSNLSNKGKHARTGKALKPMSPSANNKRLSNLKKVKKWFKRNCKWTLGRECTAQEKSDLLTFMNQ